MLLSRRECYYIHHPVGCADVLYWLRTTRVLLTPPHIKENLLFSRMKLGSKLPGVKYLYSIS